MLEIGVPFGKINLNDLSWNFSLFASSHSASFAFPNACSSPGYVIRE